MNVGWNEFGVKWTWGEMIWGEMNVGWNDTEPIISFISTFKNMVTSWSIKQFGTNCRFLQMGRIVAFSKWDELSLGTNWPFFEFGTNYRPTPQSVSRFLKLCSADTHFRFSLEYSLARNFANCSLPAGSRSTSSREKAQRFTLRVESSLVLLSRSQNDVSSLIHGFDGSAGVNIGSYSLYCSQDWIKLKQVSPPCLKEIQDACYASGYFPPSIG